MIGKVRVTSLVHYCPGDAPGTPAWLPDARAEAQAAEDAAFVERMKAAGALPADALPPHVGGTCAKCRAAGDI